MAKIKVLAVLMLVFTLFLTSLVSAEVIVDENDLLTDVSYKNLVDDDDEVDVSWQVTITNNGANTENVTLSLEGIDSDYDLSLSDSSIELSAGGSTDVTVSGTAPVDQDAGERGIGKLKVNGASYDLKTDVGQMLELKKIEFYVNEKKEKNIGQDGEKVDGLEPGDEIELIFELRNLFDEDYDEGDIEGTITVELDDSDFGDDIDEEVDFDVKAGETIDADDEEVVIRFTIPDDADDDEFTLEITIESEDDTGAEYITKWEITLVVERDEDDLRVEKVTFSPEELSCSRTTMLTVEVKNYGTDRQKNAALTIFNTALGIDENFAFEIERGTSSDNTYVYQHSITIDEDQTLGKYPLSINVLYDYNTFSDKELVDLVVKDCVELEEKEDELEETTSAPKGDEEEKEETITGDKVSSSNIIKTVEDSYNKQDFMIAVLLVTMVLIFALVVLLLMVLFKK